jgi:NAD+ diphosphatase
MPFKPALIPPTSATAQTLWFIFHEDKLLTKRQANSHLIPRSRDLSASGLSPISKQYLGTLDGLHCYAAELGDTAALSAEFSLNGLRELFGLLEEDLIWVAGRANLLVQWNRSHQYCGVCAHRTQDKADERAKICPACGMLNYPRISPAVIMAVLKDDRILLARNKRFKSGYYSVLAGFVEPGENLEECVQREVFEEVGISVNNIRYFGSQPWPFPNSLMVAFTAEYAGGEITASQSEIVDAAWFSAGNLPFVPPRITIARHLIDWYLEHRSER